MSQTFKQFLVEGRSPLVVALDNYSKFISNIDGSKEGKLIVSVPKGSGNADDFREAIKSNKMISRQLNNIDSTREPAKFIFDVNQVNEGIATTDAHVDIALGTGPGRTNLYRLPASALADLYRMDDPDDVREYVRDKGKFMNDLDDGDAFLSMKASDVEDFRTQLKDMVN